MMWKCSNGTSRLPLKLITTIRSRREHLAPQPHSYGKTTTSGMWLRVTCASVLERRTPLPEHCSWKRNDHNNCKSPLTRNQHEVQQWYCLPDTVIYRTTSSSVYQTLVNRFARWAGLGCPIHIPYTPRLYIIITVNDYIRHIRAHNAGLFSPQCTHVI